MPVLRDYQCNNGDCGNIFEGFDPWCPICGCNAISVILHAPAIKTSTSLTTRFGEDEFVADLSTVIGTDNRTKVIDITGRELFKGGDIRPDPGKVEAAKKFFDAEHNMGVLNQMGAKIDGLENMRADMGPVGAKAKSQPTATGLINLNGQDVRIRDLANGKAS